MAEAGTLCRTGPCSIMDECVSIVDGCTVGPRQTKIDKGAQFEWFKWKVRACVCVCQYNMEQSTTEQNNNYDKSIKTLHTLHWPESVGRD